MARSPAAIMRLDLTSGRVDFSITVNSRRKWESQNSELTRQGTGKKRQIAKFCLSESRENKQLNKTIKKQI